MFNKEYVNKKSHQKILAQLFIIAGFIIIMIYHPGTSFTMISCPFRELTGLYCPGCGSIRAVTQVIQGNIFQAFSHNIFAVIFFPLLIWTALSVLSILVFSKPLPRFNLSSRSIWLLFSAIILFTVLRNLPIEQLQFLQP